MILASRGAPLLAARLKTQFHASTGNDGTLPAEAHLIQCHERREHASGQSLRQSSLVMLLLIGLLRLALFSIAKDKCNAYPLDDDDD